MMVKFVYGWLYAETLNQRQIYQGVLLTSNQHIVLKLELSSNFFSWNNVESAATLKSVSNFTIADYFFRLWVIRCFQLHDGRWIVCKRSIVWHIFLFEIKEHWCQYSCASVYWTKSQQLTQAHWIRWLFYQYLHVISVDRLGISVVERCLRLELNHLIPLQKKLFYINNCTNYVCSLLQHLHSQIHSEYI